ncbi:MAG: MATE family efflux transporter [Clostridia bacterium]|nr:MATE family efflux transporter [Clostridia bacterium]
MARYGVNFTEGSVVKNHLRFALPLMATSVLQLFYNAADQVVVGRFSSDGALALAAIGATSSLNLLLINLFLGLSVGASIIISRRFGEGNMWELNKTAHSAIGISVILGIMSMLLSEIFCRDFLIAMGTPSEVLDLSVKYMRVLFIGVPFSMLYNFGAAILRSVGDTKRPLYILSATGIVNVVLNLLFVLVFKMGVEGVAIATVVANILSAVLVMYILTHSDAPYKITVKNIRLRKIDVVDFIKIGLPAGLQSIMYNLSNIVLQSSINSFGPNVMAVTTAAGSIESFIYVALNAFTQSTLTSIGQNYGAGNKKRMYQTLWSGILLSTVVGISISALIIIFSSQLLGIYIANDPETIKIGIYKLFITTSPYFLLGIMEQVGSFINGVGKVMYAAINSFVGTCVFRLVWALGILPLMIPDGNLQGYYVLNLVYPISWVITLCMHIIVAIVIRKKAFEKMNLRRA